MSIKIDGTILTVAIVMLVTAPSWAQRGSNWPAPPPSAQEMPSRDRPKNVNLEQQQLAAEQHKMLLQKDTDRLSKLVNELKQDLDKMPAGALSVDAVKKSKEVEKLAKRVRKEMEGD